MWPATLTHLCQWAHRTAPDTPYPSKYYRQAANTVIRGPLVHRCNRRMHTMPVQGSPRTTSKRCPRCSFETILAWRCECAVHSFSLFSYHHHVCRCSLAPLSRLLLRQLCRMSSYMPTSRLILTLTRAAGPASFLNCEEHELKSFRYTYVSFFFRGIFTIL
jgi:hypothetical protein